MNKKFEEVTEQFEELKEKHNEEAYPELQKMLEELGFPNMPRWNREQIYEQLLRDYLVDNIKGKYLNTITGVDYLGDKLIADFPDYLWDN